MPRQAALFTPPKPRHAQIGSPRKSSKAEDPNRYIHLICLNFNSIGAALSLPNTRELITRLQQSFPNDLTITQVITATWKLYPSKRKLPANTYDASSFTPEQWSSVLSLQTLVKHYLQAIITANSPAAPQEANNTEAALPWRHLSQFLNPILLSQH